MRGFILALGFVIGFVGMEVYREYQPQPAEYAEIDVIRTAAERNGITYKSDDWFILLAIRKAEQGEPGLEFGIMNPKADDLDKQAGWCAASIVKSRQRWVDAGKSEDFITFMGRRYCPPDDHPLNVNWVPNVTYWANELKRIDKEQ